VSVMCVFTFMVRLVSTIASFTLFKSYASGGADGEALISEWRQHPV
jgi:hypothetical protein